MSKRSKALKRRGGPTAIIVHVGPKTTGYRVDPDGHRQFAWQTISFILTTPIQRYQVVTKDDGHFKVQNA